MTTPQVVTETTAAVGKALSVKTIIMMVVLVVIVTLIVSLLMRNEVKMYDEQGNVTGIGEIKPRFKWGFQKNV